MQCPDCRIFCYATKAREMMIILGVLLVGVLCGKSSALSCSKDEMLCYDQLLCIRANQWCDGWSDCDDNSDEDYCNGGQYVAQTPNSTVPVISEFISSDVIEVTKEVIKKAAEYILQQRNSNDNWGAFTPRAIVALAFASRESIIPEQEKQLLQKRLNIALLFHLMHNTTGSPSNLALYINALYATCQDPRNFKGMDLIARLRSDIETAKKTDLDLPLPMLTLCLAGDTKKDDGAELVKMYYSANKKNRPGYKSLIALAMTCYSQTERREFPIIKDIMGEYARINRTDIYSQALFMQVLIANGYPVVTEGLARKQLPDGSFGDLLSTYYSIPVLMQSSLLNLPCNNRTYTGVSHFQNLMMNDNAEQKQVIFSIWINGATKDVRSNSLTLSFDGQKTLYDIMLMAAERDPLYRFLYTENPNGKIVYNLANIPSNVETRKSWELYTGTMGKVVLNSDKNLHLQDLGVDRIKAKNGTHFVYWLKRT